MQSMLKKDFWYDLPKELIAQEPAEPSGETPYMSLHQGWGALPAKPGKNA